MRVSNKVQRRTAIGFMIFGSALLLYMILVEDEPGAVPLAMMVGGGVWLWLLKRT